MYDSLPSPLQMLGCGIVLGLILALILWGAYELVSAFIDVSITLQ